MEYLRKYGNAAVKFAGHHPYLLTVLCCLSMIFLHPASQEESYLPFFTAPTWWLLVILPLLAVVGIFAIRNKWSDRYAAMLLIAMGFCMRIGYVLVTPCTIRQHDVLSFENNEGHAGYITYLYENGHLPDFDVRELWQFYHPPLHHSIAAAWMKLLTQCGIPYAYAGESVQLLTLAYSCLCMVIFYRILRHFDLKGAAMAIPLGIVAFHPTFIILAGSINNDMLSITFMLAAILLTLKWYRSPTLPNILKLALAIGLGMLTKLSVWMAAPAAAVVFLIVLIRRRSETKKFIGQFAAFGAVCIPLGLGWGIRNLVKWGVPLTYVPKLSENSAQYVGDHPVWQRLFDFSPKQWLYVYDCFEMYGQAYDEYNPLIGLFKTAMFDELINADYYPGITFFAELLFYSQILLAVLAFIAMVQVCRKRSSVIRLGETLPLLLTAVIVFFSYYSFCLVYAHVCTQNIRYATPLIFIGCLFLGLWMQKSKSFRIAATPAAIAFMAMSYVVYTVVGIS